MKRRQIPRKAWIDRFLVEGKAASKTKAGFRKDLQGSVQKKDLTREGLRTICQETFMEDVHKGLGGVCKAG